MNITFWRKEKSEGKRKKRNSFSSLAVFPIECYNERNSFGVHNLREVNVVGISLFKIKNFSGTFGAPYYKPMVLYQRI